MTAPDDSLRVFAGYAMKRAFNAIQADLNATLQPFGLRMVTFSALAVIGAHSGLRQSALADVLAIERPNLVLIVDELERADLIVRDRATDDRRAYDLRLTLLGRRVLDKARGAVADHDARMCAGMTAQDKDTLAQTLRTIELNGRRDNDRRTLPRA